MTARGLRRVVPDSNARPLRFLVLGCGSIGMRHIRNLAALNAGEILVHDPDEARAREAAIRFGAVECANLKHAWERGPDAVLITAPTHLHVPLALEAVGHGCHLFIEKPLSHRLEGTTDLIEAVQERDLVSLVGCNMRFHPGLMTVKKLVEEGAVGRPIAVRAQMGHYLPDWRPQQDYRTSYSAHRQQGGGIILDSIHELDYLGWLLGEIRDVACFWGKLSDLDIDAEDTAAIILRFASGVIGSVHLDYVQRTYRRTCQLIGDEGTVAWDYRNGEVRLCRTPDQEPEVHSSPSDWDPNCMYIDEMRHFLKCLTGEETTVQGVEDAAVTLRIALAALEAGESHRAIRP